MKPADFQQKEDGLMVYPGRGWRRVLSNAPLWAWRLGMGRILGRLYLVLTTTGRKSGQPRHTVLDYSVLNGRPYIVPGWGKRRQWYKNIVGNPRVTTQRAGGTESAVAVHVTDATELAAFYRLARSKGPVWAQWLASWGVRDEEAGFIAAHKDRLITLRLDPTTDKTPPPLRADLAWVWIVLLLLAVAAYYRDALF